METLEQSLPQSYCLCGQAYDPSIFMIQCDLCRDWFHGSCTNFQEHIAIEIDKYHCPRCAPIYGSSIYKPYRNWHRHDFWDENATPKPVQTGTPVFMRELRARHFSSEGEIVLHMKGSQLTENYLQQNGFDSPIIVEGRDGLEMVMPPDTFSTYDVESYIGGDVEMDVIDVTRQSDVRMKLRDFVAYYNNLNRIRVFNVVSMEFSNTGLSRMIEAPLVARKLDWVNQIWPRDYHISKPTVQKYCIMSVKDSYTDFHVDFGGTSVWYHVLSGEKIFYLIRPTTANLSLYLQWMTSSNQSERFFGDQVDQCFKCTLRQGYTMFIPTGWIHAVLTPVDSLVFGGNFLHNLNIPMQLQIYDIEKKVKTAEKFLYPHFEKINWFAADALLKLLVSVNSEEKKLPNFLLSGLKALLPYLKQWNAEKDYNITSRDHLPTTINVTKLIKDIAKEIRQAERYLNQLNPPKPERESKRKRKKPVNKDFVNYPLTKSLDFLTVPDNIVIEDLAKPPLKITLPKPIVFPYVPKDTLTEEDILNAPMDFGWSTDLLQPEHPTAVHRGGTILKIKLGAKDILPIEEEAVNSSLLLPKSIYDFHDDSEKEDDGFKLSIDENPKPKPLIKKQTVKQKQQTSWCVKNKKARTENATLPNSESDQPQNGIESLLKASALTTKFLDEDSGRTSPSTQEAIAGMLSISQTTFVAPATATGKGGDATDGVIATSGTRTTPTKPTAGKSKKNKRSTFSLSTGVMEAGLLLGDEEEEDDSNNVHQDEDYIYPSLDNSDDDDVHIFKPRGRSKIDEAWNPKARVGPLLPKMNRPAREGTKKQSVEKVLEAAAAKRASAANDKCPKRQYKKKKSKPKLVEKLPPPQAVPSTSQTTTTTATTTTTGVAVSPPQQSTVSLVVKPKKGMKTVKQRLGKILKIHKMIH